MRNESKEKSKKHILIVVSVATPIIIGIVLVIIFSTFSPSERYNKANDLLEDKKYDEAIAVYKELGSYEESPQKIIECNRKKLHSYCKNTGGVRLKTSFAKNHKGEQLYHTYGIRSEGEKLSFYYYNEDSSSGIDERCILIDLTSDNGEFYTNAGMLYTAEGTFKVSEFGSKNSLSLEEFSGYLDRSSILLMAEMSCSALHDEINPLLKETGLGLSMEDIGFAK